MPDYPGTNYVVPAHSSNYYLPENHGGVENKPKALFVHTPEEPADNNEYTPIYFSGANREGSTHYYADDDGDYYQLVPERCAAIANGLKGKPLPVWADPNTSLNWQTLSVEIEGYAADIHLTCLRGGPQWAAIVRWIVDRCTRWGIPIDRAHVMGHYQVADNRTDPGKLDIDAIVADAQALASGIELEDDMVAWVRWDNIPAGKIYRTYILSGGRKLFVTSTEQENAFRAAGYISGQPKGLTLSQLKAIPSAPGTPEPDS